MRKLRRVAALALAGMMALAGTGCSGSGSSGSGEESGQQVSASEENTGGEEESQESGDAKRACLITSTARGNEYVDLIWSGFEDLEKDGWEVKCIECFEAAEQLEQVRAMCAEGYDLIYTNGDDIMYAIWDIQDELNEMYPETRFFFLDTYETSTMPNSCTVTIDPFESCFIAGYVAANMSETGKIGLMLPVDSPILQRFEYGYLAGVDYADNGAEIIKAYTNDLYDTTKGYESTISLLETNPDIDLIAQAAYISGYGVISACSDKEIPCIGVDNWQGDIDPCVFWSAIKSMNIAVTKTAEMWENGEEIPSSLNLNLAYGGEAYAEQDLKNLPDELAAEVTDLAEKIRSGELDVFANGYEEWKIVNATEE